MMGRERGGAGPGRRGRGRTEDRGTEDGASFDTHLGSCIIHQKSDVSTSPRRPGTRPPHLCCGLFGLVGNLLLVWTGEKS